MIIDTAGNAIPRLKKWKAAGVTDIGRYLSARTGPRSKNITKRELTAIHKAGMGVFFVYEDKGGTRNELNATLGPRHAAQALKLLKAMGVPDTRKICIYFACDSNPRGQVYLRVIAYLTAVKHVMNASSKYRVGVYGPGLVCQGALDAKVTDCPWLANAKKWSGYKPFLASKKWVLLQQLPRTIGGIKVDPDIANGDFGVYRP